MMLLWVSVDLVYANPTRINPPEPFLTHAPNEASPLTAEAWGWSGWSGSAHPVVMTATMTVNDVLDGRVGLDLECMDRTYLNGYVPNLQVGGQVVSFMTGHLGFHITSPAIMEKIDTPGSDVRSGRSLRPTRSLWSSSPRATARST